MAGLSGGGGGESYTGDPRDTDDDGEETGSSSSAGGGLSSGGGDSFTGDPSDVDDDGRSSSGSSNDSSPSAGGGLSSGGGDSFTGDPSDVDDGDETSSSPSAGGGLSSGGGDSFTGDPSDVDDETSSDSSPSAGGGLSSGGGDSFSGDPSDAASDEQGTLDRLARGYTENVAQPTGQFVADATPATTIERATLGTNRTERLIEGTTTGVVQLGNVPGAIVGARDLATTAANARQRSVDPVTINGVPTGVTVPNLEGQRENSRNAAGAAAAGATAAEQNPFRFAGNVFGAAVGGAVGARGLANTLRRIDQAGGSVPSSGGSSGAVRTGRSDVGTGGRGSLLDADTVDDAMGVTGPSRRSVVSNRIDRTLANVQDSFDSLDIGDFASDRRGQLQTPRRGRDTGDSRTDFTDAPDRTRPDDAGGTFEDVRQDSLTQTQDALRDQAQRPDLGDYDGAPDPFGPSARGPTMNPDTGVVELERTTGAVEDVSSGASGTSSASGGSTAGAGGVFAGLGRIDPVNDPTGISPGSMRTEGTSATIGTGTDTVGDDPFVGDIDVDDLLEGDGTATGAGEDGGVDGTFDVTTPTDTVSDSGTDTDVGTGTDVDVDTDVDLGTGTGVGPDLDTGVGTDTPLDTVTDTEPIPGLDTPSPPAAPTDPVSPPQARPPRRPPKNPPGPPGGGFGGGRPPLDFDTDLGGVGVPDADIGFTETSDVFDTGVASADEALDGIFGSEDDEEDYFGEEDRGSTGFTLGFASGGSGSSSAIDDIFEGLL